MACKICGKERCVGRYLLHPKEVRLYVPRIKKTNLNLYPNRTFELVDSPSSGEIFITFKELHVIAGPEEDLEVAKETPVDVYIKDLQDIILGNKEGGVIIVGGNNNSNEGNSN